jgi:RHS repeat-associated protein
VTQRVDRLGRIIAWEYDDLYRNTAEKWYDGVNLVHTLNWEYDAAGQLTDAYDTGSVYGYTYDGLGRLETESQSFGDFSPLLEYERTYNAAGSVLSVQAIIGGTADFENAFTYDNLHRITRLEQAEYGSGNTVAEKRFDFAYDAASAFTRLDRYADLAGSEYVASTHYAYDGIGRLLRLTHNDSTSPAAGFGNSPLAGYQYAYDAASRMLSIDSYLDDLTEYTHDDTNQLTAADHYSQTDETYTYDANGNRDDANYDVDPNNQMATDGIYTFTYDAEGNRSSRVKISNDYVTVYEWDHRNRLTAVIEQDDEDNVLTSTHYTYDVNNRWIRRTVDPDGDSGSDPLEETFFSHLDGQIALQFDGTTAGDLSHRYAWNPAAVDQLLSDENALNEILYPFTDHLGTTRDLAEYDDGPDTPSIVNHRYFDSFGNLVDETNGSITILFGFTGRPFDESTGLQNNWNRWYVSLNGVWLSEDPIGFDAGDTSLSRYVHNSPATHIDPSGLEKADAPHWVNGGVVTLTNLSASNILMWGEMLAEDVKDPSWPIDLRNSMPIKWLEARTILRFTLTGTAVLKDTIKYGNCSINIDISIGFSFNIEMAVATRINWGLGVFSLFGPTGNVRSAASLLSLANWIKLGLNTRDFYTKASKLLISNGDLARYAQLVEDKIHVSPERICSSVGPLVDGLTIKVRGDVRTGLGPNGGVNWMEVNLGGRPWYEPSRGGWYLGSVSLPFDIPISPND